MVVVWERPERSAFAALAKRWLRSAAAFASACFSAVEFEVVGFRSLTFTTVSLIWTLCGFLSFDSKASSVLVSLIGSLFSTFGGSVFCCCTGAGVGGSIRGGTIVCWGVAGGCTGGAACCGLGLPPP